MAIFFPDSSTSGSSQRWPDLGHRAGADLLAAVPALRQTRREPAARDASAPEALQEPRHPRRLQDLGRRHR